ncbi:MAG: hypothetical protein HRU13_08910, partial [Phycisphaerales bacterium]|nr:hypothetical protein [Phycisphaerales bacterium]
TETSGVLRFEGVSSDLKLYPDEIACTPAEPGTEHDAAIAAGLLTIWIAPIITPIDCEDIE